MPIIGKRRQKQVQDLLALLWLHTIWLIAIAEVTTGSSILREKSRTIGIE